MTFLHSIGTVLYQWGLLLARPVVPFILLPVLMILLVVGTVAQRSLGLYDAQKIFFTSPPALLLLGLLTLSLLCKFILKSEWRREKIGIHLSHLGILILLIGGMFSASIAREGMMVIGENERSNIVQDYHIREFKFSIKGNPPVTVPFSSLHKGDIIPLPGLDGTIEIIDIHRNIKISENPQDDPTRKGMAQFMALSPAPSMADDEANINGMTFRLSKVDPDLDGVYIAFDAMPKPVEVGPVAFILSKQHRLLPFEITLTDFVAEHHPGTQMARAYHSDVIVKDGDISWPVRIEMNKPLRYRGYTLFQSSFLPPAADDGVEVSVLAVVENKAWPFPYLGTGLMAIGLLWHALLMAGRRRQI
jgi:hypothetical protein